MTLQEKGMALVVVLALNVALWTAVAVYGGGLLLVAPAIVFGGLSVALVHRMLRL